MEAARDEPDIKRRHHIVVRGRVQGVGYRIFAHATATSLGVEGWVRNLPDGSVELEAQGPEGVLALFESSLEAGPRGADVSRLEVDDIGPELEDRGRRDASGRSSFPRFEVRS